MGIFAIPPIVAGPKKYRVPGIIALLIALFAAAFDHHAGKRTQYKIDEIRKQYEEISMLRTDVVEEFQVRCIITGASLRSQYF